MSDRNTGFHLVHYNGWGATTYCQRDSESCLVYCKWAEICYTQSDVEWQHVC